MPGRWIFASVIVIGACADPGSVALRFDLPDDQALQPTGAENLTLVARVGDDTPRATTTAIGDGMSLDLGDLPIVDDIWLSAEMRTSSGELVGYGQASAPIEVAPEATVEATIPVRRPFVYLAGASGRLLSLDGSAGIGAFQGQVTVSGAPAIVADVAGTDVASITSAGALTYVSTSTHGSSTLPGMTVAAGALDAISTPDGAILIIGHGGAGAQVSVIDTASGDITVAPTPGNAERVAITMTDDGTWWGVALIGRATADTGCLSSRLVTFPLADPETATVIDAGVGISDLAGDARAGVVLVADRCGDRVLRFDPATGGLDVSAPVMTLPGPTTVVASDRHVWAVGHDLRRPVAGEDVPDGVVDAWLVLGEADVTGENMELFELPPVVERVLATDVDFPDQDLTQDLHANDVVARDLALLPGGEQLAITVSTILHGDEVTDGLSSILPQLDVTTEEYWLLDASTRVTAQRVRSRCTVVKECSFSCYFDNWSCLPDLDVPVVGDFVPSGMTALFGAR